VTSLTPRATQGPLDFSLFAADVEEADVVHQVALRSPNELLAPPSELLASLSELLASLSEL
jgi:hypothetical protein